MTTETRLGKYFTLFCITVVYILAKIRKKPRGSGASKIIEWWAIGAPGHPILELQKMRQQEIWIFSTQMGPETQEPWDGIHKQKSAEYLVKT